MSTAQTKSESQPPSADTHGFNPISHHWVRKDGPTWLRLVKCGAVKDPALEQTIAEKALAREKKVVEEKDPEVSSRPKRTPAKAQRVARKVVDAHRSELDNLKSDAAGEHLRKLLARRLTLADTTTDIGSESSEDEAPKRATRPSSAKGPLASRIRLKSAPIPIPDRRAALRKSLAEPVDSATDED